MCFTLLCAVPKICEFGKKNMIFFSTYRPAENEFCRSPGKPKYKNRMVVYRLRCNPSCFQHIFRRKKRN